MKKLYGFIAFVFITSSAFSQVSFTVLEPSTISGGYEFTSNGDAPNWGLANLNNPADAVTDTVVLANDGTPGINAQGVPFANEACSALINNVAGKIVMVYRYDGFSTNDCWASTRVLNAQNAGAVGVIIVNREDNVFGYNGTPDGPSVTIPFAFITKSDGALIRSKIDAGDDVVAFIGNKLGLYQNDVGIVKTTTLAPILAAVPSQTSLNASEFGFDVGTMIYNYGSSTQNSIMLTTEVTGSGGTWTETAGPYSLAMGDSIDVFTGGTNNINAFSFANYPDGNYQLKYTIDIGVTDSSSFDNTINYFFTVSDSMFSYCNMDTLTNLPAQNTYSRSTDPSFAACIVYDNPNGSRLAAEGVYISAVMAWNSTNPLDGEFVTAYVFQWDDNFVDLNDANLGFSALNVLTQGDYFFNAGEDSDIVYIPFDDPVLLSDNQRYLTCLEVWNQEVWMGYNNRIEYNRHVNTYLQPLVPVRAGTSYFALGFGTDNVPAMAIKVFDEVELGIKENPSELIFHIYPNPTSDFLNIYVPELTSGKLIITDIAGKTVLVQDIFGTSTNIQVSNLQSGQYILRITDENGMSSTKRFCLL
jgi:Secretion system C-terminal sorting domain/PA domain